MTRPTLTGFYDRQARSTRNTPSSVVLDWLTGGLNSQIEHHMFPTMARRNLPDAGAYPSGDD